MNTKVLKKLTERVRIVEEGDYYIVESKNAGDHDWHQSPTYSSFKKALKQKHNMLARVIRDMGFLPFLRERRMQRVNKKRRKLAKRGKLKLRV